jgi:hypothetical protein
MVMGCKRDKSKFLGFANPSGINLLHIAHNSSLETKLKLLKFRNNHNFLADVMHTLHFLHSNTPSTMSPTHATLPHYCMPLVHGPKTGMNISTESSAEHTNLLDNCLGSCMLQEQLAQLGIIPRWRQVMNY